MIEDENKKKMYKITEYGNNIVGKFLTVCTNQSKQRLYNKNQQTEKIQTMNYKYEKLNANHWGLKIIEKFTPNKWKN